MSWKRVNRMLLLLPAIALAACQMPQRYVEVKPDDPNFAPVYSQNPIASYRPNGAIYQEGYGVDLYQRRAHRIGDILTIMLDESTSARKSSTTTFTKESDSSVVDATAEGKGFLGTGIELNGAVSSSVDFSGESDADLSNQLQGSITVTVSGVFPNGNLEVRGEKWLQLSQGNEYIRINGLVRKEDINPDNTIASTRVADVRIAYSGTGVLSNANKASWLTRFFVSDIWPF
jgi:flagellar L-ring protein precursor FlgH